MVGPKELAKIFGYSDESLIHRMVKEGYPAPVRHKYDLAKWVQHHVNELKKEIRRKRASDIPEWEMRIKKNEADESDIKLAKLRAEVISVAEHTKIWDRIVIAVRRRLESQSGRLGPNLLNVSLLSQVKQTLDQDNRETLSELAAGYYAEPDPDLPGQARPVPKDRKKLRSHAKSKRKRVG